MAEYNPFHNGHLYHIEKTKKELGADCVVVVMSGNFVMRGEPALFDKFSRGKAAVMCGADLVVELPVPYALSSAEYFAYGSVSILDSLNIVDYISFGSENGNADILSEIADIFLEKSTIEKIAGLSKEGVNLFDAYEEIFDEQQLEVLKKPNNILGINYLKALKRFNSKIKVHTLERKGTGYNDVAPAGNLASATTMRELVNENKDISAYMPIEAYNIFKNKTPVKENEFNNSMIYSLRIKNKDDFLKYADTGEGLHNLIKRAADEYNTIDDIAHAIKSKRYSYTRIKRILYNSFLDIPSELRAIKPQYARVLAFNEKGRELMNKVRKISEIPVITNLKKEMFEKYPTLSYDVTAGKIYSIINKDYEEKIIL